MKKKVIISISIFVILVIIGTVGLFAYQDYMDYKLNPKNNLGMEQILKNDTDKATDAKVEQKGYYDVTTLTGNNGYDEVGRLFVANEEVLLLEHTELKLSPAQLASPQVSDGKYELTKNGSYFSGIQIPEGNYSVTYEGDFTPYTSKEGQSDGMVGFNIKNLDDKGDKAIPKFTKDSRTHDITLGKNEKIKIKTTDKNFKFILVKK